jgi:hypothetical protein
MTPIVPPPTTPPLFSIGLLTTLLTAVFTSALTFVGALYWVRRDAQEKSVAAKIAATLALQLRVVELETKLGLLTQSIQPIAAAFQAVLVKQLTHYHTPKLDALLKKLGPPLELTAEDEVQLHLELKLRTKDMGDEIDESERAAAGMLPLVMTRVKYELESPPSPDLIVVRVPRSHE